MKTWMVRIWIGLALLATGLVSASAQSFPSRPVTIVVPFAAGGPTDTLARILAERMRASLNQAVIIENVTGASGSIGGGRVARAAPDGYTIAIGHWGTHVLNGAIYSLSYDLLDDFEPIALIANGPQLIVSRPDLPAGNLQELIAWLKANSGKVTVGTSGPGSGAHVAGVFFAKLTGTNFQFVPYRGAGPVLADLMASHIDISFDQVSNSLPHVREGRVKAFAVTAKTRLPSAPDIPTVDEAGLPGLYTAYWHGLWAPKGTPKEVIAVLNAAIVASLADPALRARFANLGQEIPPPERLTPQALRAHHEAEIKAWWPIVKAANIKGD